FHRSSTLSCARLRPNSPTRLCDSAHATGGDAVVGIVRRPRTAPPQPELARPCATGQRFEPGGVPPSPMRVEVRRSGADRDKANVDVQAVANTDHIPQQPPVLIHTI